MTGRFQRTGDMQMYAPSTKKKGKQKQPTTDTVSLTSQLSKMFETFTRNALAYHLEKNYLTRDTQHAFRNRISCLSKLL